MGSMGLDVLWHFSACFLFFPQVLAELHGESWRVSAAVCAGQFRATPLITEPPRDASFDCSVLW